MNNMDTLNQAIVLAIAKYEEVFGEDAKLEEGDSFATVFNDAIIVISFENKTLKFDVLAGTLYFIDMSLNLTKP